MFTNGNMEAAKKIMIPKPEIRKQDLVRLSFVGGFLLAVFVVFIVSHLGLNQQNLMINGVPAKDQRLILHTYRLAFSTNLLVYLLATAVQIFRHYKINYEYILGVTRSGSVSPWALY